MTRLVGLIGQGLKHSISPQFQQAAFDHLGLDVRYELWDVEEGGLPEVVERLRESARLGANVTIPYKEKVMPLLDDIDPAAAGIGAVNTIVKRDSGLSGSNTDSTGFLTALRREGGFDPEGRRAVLLGAGGVARAAGFALAGAGVVSLILTDVVAEKAEGLAADLRRSAVRAGGQGPVIEPLSPDRPEFDKAVLACDLLVNCSPVGTKHGAMEGRAPLNAGLVPKSALVYDLVYNPAETRLLRDARAAGARTLGGLAMLVYQGAASFGMWTGHPAPVDIMMQAAREALGQ